MKKFLLFSLLFISFQLSAQTNTDSKNEILIVYFSWLPTESSGIYYFYGGNTVTKPLPARTKEDDRETPYIIYSKEVMADTFASLYAEGWKLVPQVESGTSTYFFERPVGAQ